MDGGIASVHLTRLLVAPYNGNDTFAGNDSKLTLERFQFSINNYFLTGAIVKGYEIDAAR